VHYSVADELSLIHIATPKDFFDGGGKRITLEEKETLWGKVLKEFPSDPLLIDLHFAKELVTAITKRAEKVRSIRRSV